MDFGPHLMSAQGGHLRYNDGSIIFYLGKYIK